MDIYDDIGVWRLLKSLCETNSLTLTASIYGIDLTVASRKLQRLENKTGRILVDRTVRPMRATRDAMTLIDQIDVLVRSQELLIERIDNMVADTEEIRLMLPATVGEFAHRYLHQYQQQVPSVKFSLEIPIDLRAFKAGKSDILVLTGESKDLKDVVKIPRGRMYFLALASPAWIATHGMVTHPDQLSQWDVISLPWNPDGITKRMWKQGMTAEINSERMTISTNASNIKNFALQGYGIALDLPFFYCADEILSGKLKPVLDGWHRASQNNYVICSTKAWNRSICRTFAHWFATRLENHFETQAKRLMHAGIELH